MIKPLTSVANDLSPGVATAAAQKNLKPKELQQLAAFGELKKMHQYLTTIPQNDAYKNFNKLTPEYQTALKTFFSPKYTQEDKGFVGNILRSLKSSATYAGTTFKEIGMQIAGVPFAPTTNLNPAEALLTIGTGFPVSLNKETGVTTGAGKALDALVRPQNKLIKQPYIAGRLSEMAGQPIQEQFGVAGRSFLEGAKELLPGGVDANVEGNAAKDTWRKFWETASDQENVFDTNQTVIFEKTLKPEVAYVGKLLAGKKNFFDNYEEILKNPETLKLIQRYTSGDEEATNEIAKAVTLYEQSKVSPGRDVARTLVYLFPFEAEKAKRGEPINKVLFNAISGPTDLGVTFGLDPLILFGKAKKTSDVARFGLMKMGEDPRNLEKAFTNRSVRNYWDTVGKLLQDVNTGNIAQKGAALTRIEERFPEINLEVAQYMAPNIKDADTALNFFRGGDIIDDISKGNAGLRRDPLIPRYTQARWLKDWARDGILKATTKLGGEYKALNLPDNVDDISKIADENPISWTENIGYRELTTPSGIASVFAGSGKRIRGTERTIRGTKTEGKFVSKDASTAAKIDKVMRQFSIAPKQDRMISLSDASSATQVYRLMRTVVDKGSASTFRAAWIAAEEGQRLLMYRGLVKTLAYGMGLDHSTAGRAFISKIDETANELYSVNQSMIDLGDWTRILGTMSSKGLAAPSGTRKLVAEATTKIESTGLVSRVLASSGSEMARITDQVKELKNLKKELTAKTAVSAEEADTIKSIVEDIDTSLKILGGTLGKMRVARKDIKKYIDDLDPIEGDLFNAAELNGAQRGVRAYQLSQSRYMPNLVDLRKFELRGNVFSAITGKVGESAVNQAATDIWSYLNLYPRLGLRTTVEEGGTFFLMNGIKGIADYFTGRRITIEGRRALLPTTKISAIKEIEKEVSPLGIFYRTLDKITGNFYTKQEKIDMANNVELLGQNINKALMKDRFIPEFLRTDKGKRVAGYAEDWAVGNGKDVMEEITGAVRQAEFKEDAAQSTSNYLRQYGPSVTLNVDIASALKNVKFSSAYSEIAYNRPGFLLSWYLDLHNTIGKRNIWGQIVFSNINKKEEDVIEILAKYLDGKGNDLAKKFAIYQSEGSYKFARRIYADSTSTLRDSSGRLNKSLIEEIKASGGVNNFDFKQLQKYNQPFQTPRAVLGKEQIPLQTGDAVNVIDRVMKNGYAWIGKQIALLDREPITYANYITYREQLGKYQSNFKNGLINSGLDAATADKLARQKAHEVGMNLARQRTLGYVDNSDVRTNLAFNIRNFGRYYRATEDFYRRAARITKYEKQAIMRLAILNQTFEHSGFVHKDSRGEMYFTYPGDDILNWALGNSLFRVFGIPGAQPMSVEFGGKVKMLTPSLDPESAAPRLGGPFVGISFSLLKNLPVLGDWMKSAEPVVTGGIPNQDWWKTILPINVQRAIDLGFRNSKELMTEQKFSAAVQSMRLLISTGNGPKTGADINPFMNNAVIQASNIMYMRFGTGFITPASVQMFNTKDVPKEMIDAGYYSWDTEFIKILKRYENQDNAYEKAYVVFATLFPSKTVYAVSKTQTGTEASFQKTYEAAKFVKENKDLINNHKQAASFFIPINGTSDIESYQYLKSQGFVKNKDLEVFLREAASATAKQKYNASKDEYDQAIVASQDPGERQYLRGEWTKLSDFYKKINPLLEEQISPSGKYKALKREALDDLRDVVSSGRSPNKKLANVFAGMIKQYDDGMAEIDSNTGRTDYDVGLRKYMRDNLKTYLLEIAGDNPNAKSLYYNVFETLIGE